MTKGLRNKIQDKEARQKTKEIRQKKAKDLTYK